MPKKSVKVEPPKLLNLSDAERLDSLINDRIRQASENLAQTYLEVGSLLKQMRDTEGYRALNFDRWEHYLDSKTEFGRSYLSYLYKIGSAGDLKGFLDKGLSGAKLIEFAKKTDFPEKIPQLIDATWETVKDKSARETRALLETYVLSNVNEYRKKKLKRGGRPRSTIKERLEKEFHSLPQNEQIQFLTQVKDFLKARKTT